MKRPIDVRPEAGYRLWLRYDDGAEGTVDLSDLVGRGVFEAWKDPRVFEGVKLTAHGALEWPGGLDLCPDAIYLRLTRKTPEDVFPALRAAAVDA
jgi:hypothetical protein